MISFKGLGWLSIIFVLGLALLLCIACEVLLGLNVQDRGLTIGIGIVIGSVINWFAGKRMNKENTKHFIAGMKMQNFSVWSVILGIVLIVMYFCGIRVIPQ